uniref:Uncharacterized protein n=1 Tax=Rhizophora mucronata TaxID=61149 RepID=A0A2P2QT83_RHIMU
MSKTTKLQKHNIMLLHNHVIKQCPVTTSPMFAQEK